MANPTPISPSEYRTLVDKFRRKYGPTSQDLRGGEPTRVTIAKAMIKSRNLPERTAEEYLAKCRQLKQRISQPAAQAGGAE